jgi:hypothetical protein
MSGLDGKRHIRLNLLAGCRAAHFYRRPIALPFQRLDRSAFANYNDPRCVV